MSDEFRGRDYVRNKYSEGIVYSSVEDELLNQNKCDIEVENRLALYLKIFSIKRISPCFYPCFGI